MAGSAATRLRTLNAIFLVTCIYARDKFNFFPAATFFITLVQGDGDNSDLHFYTIFRPF